MANEVIANKIDTISIRQLRDGRVFYIPAYQRGYRWNEDQVKYLLQDLFEFLQRDKKVIDQKKTKEFYCLQPVIVKRIIDSEKIEGINQQNGIENEDSTIKYYEVIDGQQRLTTLFILMSFVSQKLNKSGQKFYRLAFESRPKMYTYLSELPADDFSNIDEKHVYDTWKWIDEWFDKKTAELNSNATDNEEDELDDAIDVNDLYQLFEKLLRQPKLADSACGSVQVIWYEIDGDRDPVKEFLNTNNGKISLTEAELIKALFLQKRNFTGDSANIKQLEKALDWERIENTLHQNDFWYFIDIDRNRPANRIEKILRLAANFTKQNGVVSDVKLPNEENALFNHYYKKFEGLTGDKLEKKIEYEWSDILNCFRAIEDWYTDPIKYNLIGFLTHANKNLNEIYKIYLTLESDDKANEETFIEKLKGIIKNVDKGHITSEETLDIEYSSKNASKFRRIFMLLNVHMLNSQLVEARKLEKEKIAKLLEQKKFDEASQRNANIVSPSYKFPFDVYIAEGWDIEHIDSQTTNGLAKKTEKQEWVEGYAYLFDNDTDDTFKNALTAAYQQNNDSQWDVCINLIRAKVGETSEMKDCLGNLTLLNAEINRGYGNKIFPDKRIYILERIKEGKYVPYCTQMVFYKNFDSEHMSKPTWDNDCKLAYEKFVIEQIKEYM